MAKEYHMARKKGRIQDVAAAEALAKEGQMSETNEETSLAAEDTIFAAEIPVSRLRILFPRPAKNPWSRRSMKSEPSLPPHP
jgi:hypothetical protein